MTPVRLEPAASRSRVKHSTTEPLCSRNILDRLTRSPKSLKNVVLKIASVLPLYLVSTLNILTYTYETSPFHNLIWSVCFDGMANRVNPEADQTAPLGA